MRNLLVALTVTMILSCTRLDCDSSAQVLPPAKRAAQVRITHGPSLELTHGDLAIIRWTSTNPGGSDEHFGVVRYGTDPKDLNKTAKAHIRLNRDHPFTIFRVRLNHLKPKTVYYYTVSSIESDGTSDRVASAIHDFDTPGAGERVVAYPSSMSFRRPN